MNRAGLIIGHTGHFLGGPEQEFPGSLLGHSPDVPEIYKRLKHVKGLYC